jgi:NAD(P)-dependent dehydrogenase (short-subunit alcohol dehydrogenase family)
MKSRWLSEDTFAGQVAFVTGAGSGINQGIARMLAAHGAAVVVVGRRAEKLEETVQRIEQAGGRALACPCDVRDAEAMAAAAKQGAETFGPYSLVVAGAAGNFLAPAAGLSSNGFGAVVDIDLKGSYNTFRACFDYFHADGGACLAISAPQAQVPMPMQSHVCSAKAGVEMLVKTLAMEWGARGIRVNALSPGYVEGTVGGDLMAGEHRERLEEALPLGRFTTVEEMAQMALSLLGPVTAYMTGQTVALDGGVSLLGGGGMMTAFQGGQ